MAQHVASQSDEVAEMSCDWELCEALLEGTRAMRAAGQKYLPKWPAEEVESYKARLSVAVLFPAYSRTVATLTGKPFSKPVTLSEDMPTQVAEWLQNADLEGRNLHAFAAECMGTALGYGLGGILVEYPVVKREPGARPLTQAECASGQLERPVQRLLGADAEDALPAMLQEAWWTDGLPVVLPTPERVAAMLRGTHRQPDEVIGRMRPTATQEDWSYTVEQVAVNAVMAGAKPQQLPVILALAASQVTALHSSTSGFAAMVVVNGPIRHEIGMNSGLGALGPFNQANAAIGRAWSLLSRNLGGGAVPGITYRGTQGNPLNYNGICCAENEERSPWEPFHVQQGFEAGQSTISLFRGRSYTHLLEIRQTTWQAQLLNLVAGFTPVPGTGLTLLVEPLVARALHEREGFATKQQLADWFHANATLSWETYWDYQLVVNYIEPLARKGQEPFASYLAQGPGSQVPRFADPKKISTVVVGGEKNAYWYATDFMHLTTLPIDPWR